MRAIVQRVERASVAVVGQSGERDEVGRIGRGLCVLLGATHDDGPAQALKMATKLWNLRIFDDADGVMNRSLQDNSLQDDSLEDDSLVGSSLAGGAAGDTPVGDVLVVSQFTVYGDVSRGRRPSWIAAARPEHAEPLVDAVVTELRRLGAVVATGRFRTDMRVELVNDGPVTVIVEV